jgi:hypothetical protein
LHAYVPGMTHCPPYSSCPRLLRASTWMAGPSPAMTSSQHSSKTDVDGRDEPGHDESKDVMAGGGPRPDDALS